METIFAESLTVSIETQKRFAEEQKNTVLTVARLLADTLRRGNKLLLFGNGGSAADAQHMAAEFVNRFLIDRPPLAAIALTTDASILTSIGNDFSFDDIFSKQLQALAKEGDVAIGISTSGNSANVVKAMETAAAMGMVRVALTGAGGGRLADCVDYLLAVPSRHTPAIQETHLWVEHLLCQLVDHLLFSGND